MSHPAPPPKSRIAAIWADVLGITAPGVHDDFFDLGGHSLKAVQIVTALRSTFGVDAAMRHLFEQPTIAGLAAIVDVLAVSATSRGIGGGRSARGGRNMMSTAEFLSKLRERDVRVWVEDGRLKCDAPPGTLDEGLREQLGARKQELLTLISAARTTLSAPRSLVPLKTSGEYPPLFARPGHSGDVFCYRALAEHIDERRPLYGVEPKGLDGSPAPETVEEMAAYEVAQIRAAPARRPLLHRGLLRRRLRCFRVGATARSSR